MFEKLRSLIQRNRPRDIYDIWYIMNSDKSPDNKMIKELLTRKAGSKNIEITNVEQFVNTRKQRKNKRAWENSLKQHLSVRSLPDFDVVYTELHQIIETILKS